ncbi:MAG: 1-deoxy-D-xylulose-5-phosphate synthase [Mycobacterium sp.]
MGVDRTESDSLLASVRSPADIQRLSAVELMTLAEEMRRLMIDVVTTTGGHLGAGLGTVELTIALHRVFTSPRDILVFDTGHQTYPHKLLTGRVDQFSMLRQAKGLSGYPSRTESSHDWIENSHASTSLAWVDGIAKAFELQGQRDRHVVAVVGDGALTGGLAWEGLNNLGAASRPVIVVLNDNGRSYDPTAGAVAAHLQRLRDEEEAGPNMFEGLGFAYIGPVDGHDVKATCEALQGAIDLAVPVVVHIVTAKGRGYAVAEANEDDRMHACGIIDSRTGRLLKPPQLSWTDVFEHELVDIAETNHRIVGMTAAMRLPTGLGELSRRYPERVFDSGIAEQHLMVSAAGMAMAEAHPVVVLYSTFLHRAFDQLLLDVGLHRLPVTLVLDRAGITGPDGPSHHGLWDLRLLTCVPGLRIACPRDATRLRQQLRAAVETPGPTALRYPKGIPGEDIPAVATVDGVDIVHGCPHRRRDVLLVGLGAMTRPCVEAAALLERESISVTVVDPQWVWPLNPALAELANRHRITVCVEDGVAEAGIGAHLVEDLRISNPRSAAHAHGLPTTFIEHGDRKSLLAQYGLSSSSISAMCRGLLAEEYRRGHENIEPGGDCPLALADRS